MIQYHLEISYLNWKSLAQSWQGSCYHLPLAPGQLVIAYTRVTEQVYSTTCGGTDYNDWAANFPASVEVDCAEDALALLWYPEAVVTQQPLLGRLLNGGSGDLRVDGGSTPADFDCGPSASLDAWITELSFMAVLPELQCTGDTFLSSDALANGIAILVRSRSQDSALWSVSITEDFGPLAAPGGFEIIQSGLQDILLVRSHFQRPLLLKAASSDYIRVRVQDDLSARGLIHLSATAKGSLGVV